MEQTKKKRGGSRPRDPWTRFMEKVRIDPAIGMWLDQEDGSKVWEPCWNWKGACWRSGYGAFWGSDSKPQAAHNYAYQHLKPDFDPKLVRDHLCRNRACVNVKHLDQVTQRENILRGYSPGATAQRTNRCKRGHEYTPENTIQQAGGRKCRICQARNVREWHLRRKARQVLASGQLQMDLSPAA